MNKLSLGVLAMGFVGGFGVGEAWGITMPDSSYVSKTVVNVVLQSGSFEDKDGIGESDVYGKFKFGGATATSSTISNDNTPNWSPDYATSISYDVSSLGYTERLTARFYDEDAVGNDDSLGYRHFDIDLRTKPFNYVGNRVKYNLSGETGYFYAKISIAPLWVNLQSAASRWNTGRTLSLGISNSHQFKRVNVGNGGVLNVNGGDLNIQSGGELQLQSDGTIRTEVFNRSSGSEFSWSGGMLHFTGDLDFDSGSEFSLRDGVLGAGRTLRVDGRMNLNASDRLELAGGVLELGDELDVLGGELVEGTGEVRMGDGTFINVDGGGEVLFSLPKVFEGNQQFTSASGVSGFGGGLTVGGASEGRLTVQGGEVNFGGDLVVREMGIVVLSGGEVDFDGQEVLVESGGIFEFDGGEVRGLRRFDGDLRHDGGRLYLGDGDIELEILGDYVMDEGSEIFIDLLGTAAEDVGEVITVGGFARVDGAFRLEGYVPVAGEEIVLLAAEVVIGEFDSVVLPAVGDYLAYDLVYEDERVVLGVNSLVAGDGDNDGDVDGDDLDLVMAHFGGGDGGDVTGDGVTDLADLFAVRNNFGFSVGAVAVPEPSSVGLLLVGGLLLSRRR